MSDVCQGRAGPFENSNPPNSMTVKLVGGPLQCLQPSNPISSFHLASAPMQSSPSQPASQAASKPSSFQDPSLAVCKSAGLEPASPSRGPHVRPESSAQGIKHDTPKCMKYIKTVPNQAKGTHLPQPWGAHARTPEMYQNL